MKITLVPGRELGSDLVAAWIRLQSANPDLASPYFHPEFTRIVATARNDVEVAVLESEGSIVALLPFQREQETRGRPVGGIISDYHGLICAQQFRFSPVDLLERCRLHSWDFDHLIAAQKSFEPFHWSTEISPQIDLSNGYKAYARQLRLSGFQQIPKKIRRIEEEFGRLQFVAHSHDVAILEAVLEWKSLQYRQARHADLFAPGWIRDAVKRIFITSVDGWSGVLSLLYAGDRLVAGHFGMRSRRIWHYWFPSYEPESAKYSPGLILLLKMAEYAAEAGTPIIDLGKGMNAYKERLMNSASLLASGRLEVPSWKAFYARSSRAVRSRLRSSQIGPPARAVLHWLRGQKAD
jgi:CelD/BcsL family acetyltransferase involved in cellulose biosynthesis